MIIALLQPFQRPSPVIGQIRFPIRHECFGEESWFPFRALVLAGRRFLALPFFEFLFEFGGLTVLLVEDGFGDAVPEAPAFVGELLILGWDDLGDGPERVKVDEELGFLIITNVSSQLALNDYRI